MQNHDLTPQIHILYNNVTAEMNKYGYGELLLYDLVEEELWSSFMFDQKNNCIWYKDAADLMALSLNLGLIDEMEYENFLSKSLLGVDLND